MKAARLFGVGDIRLVDEPRPEAAAGESLVEVLAVGLCGSDLHWFGQGQIGDATLERPLVPGHEIAGRALDGPHAGRLVAVDPAVPCGRCERCREGNPNLCPTVRFAGHADVDGGLREEMAWPTHRLVPLPEGFTADDGALLEPLGVAVHAWDLGHVRVGARVAVVGVGPIGLFLVQLAARLGSAEVVAVEPLAHRARAAAAAGARVLEADEPRLAASDVVFEVSGQPDAVRTALQLARPGGRVVLVGIPDDDVTAFPAALARRKGLTIAVVRRMKDVYPRAIGLVQRGVVDLSGVVSDRFGLDAVPDAFTFAAERRGLKVVVAPSAAS